MFRRKENLAEIKGILLNAWMDYLKNRYGAQVVSHQLEILKVEDRLLLSSHFLASNWYPYSTLYSLRNLTRSLATSSDRNLSIEIGRFMAEYVFTGVYRSMLVKDPIKQVEKFSRIREFFFRDTRQLETEVEGRSRCLVRYNYEIGANPTRAICESLGGFWSMTLELAGASAVKTTHPKCVTSGGPCCEFIFEWQSARSGK
jgi:hypothetical protein